MTIFDSIKYPISDPASADQLNAVPHAIKRKWVNHLEYYYPSNPGTGYRTVMHTFYTKENVTLLRRVILEYDT